MRDDDEDAGGMVRMVRVLGIDSTTGNDEVVVDNDNDDHDHDHDVQPATLLLLPLKEFSMPRNKISITIDHLDRPTYDH